MNTSIQSNSTGPGDGVSQRASQLFAEHQTRVYRQTDRLFAILMVLQWIGGIVMAVCVSPNTWIGSTPYVHTHVWAAVILGGIISIAPIVMALRFPGSPLTRHVIALAQACWSALLIHLSGGRIETHFHIFGSLAFLAFYRDWRVLITATAVVAVDHFMRGMWWPLSVYGVSLESPFRWVEHASWVVFEDIFLIVSCLRGQREGKEICRRRASLEVTNAEIEERVLQRTRQLEAARRQLEEEFEEHRTTQRERERLYSELAAVSRQAGMAEVATGVLHNVGNVLNSVNVSATLVAEKLRGSRVQRLAQASQVISENEQSLTAFLTQDARGKHFPRLLNELAANLTQERDSQLEELGELLNNIEHIKAIVSVQQSFAQKRGAAEPTDLAELVEDALKINDASLLRHSVEVIRRFEPTPVITIDKHKAMQILVNLISNAKHALDNSGRDVKQMTLAVAEEDECVRIAVQDNGVGIERENLQNIFVHGFTTKANGHGFGLHSSAMAAQELGGSLSVHSEGAGRGATFTLLLPLPQQSVCEAS